MNKAFLLILAMMMAALVACETGLPRFSPPSGTNVENGGTNRYSFMGGGNINYTAPDGGFAVDAGETGDTGADY